MLRLFKHFLKIFYKGNDHICWIFWSLFVSPWAYCIVVTQLCLCYISGKLGKTPFETWWQQKNKPSAPHAEKMTQWKKSHHICRCLSWDIKQRKKIPWSFGTILLVWPQHPQKGLIKTFHLSDFSFWGQDIFGRRFAICNT